MLQLASCDSGLALEWQHHAAIPGSGLLHELRFQARGAETIDLAVDIVIAVHEADVFAFVPILITPVEPLCEKRSKCPSIKQKTFKLPTRTITFGLKITAN